MPIKAKFTLEIAGEPSSSIPPVVLMRCFGKQKPLAPHAQRLLLASRKEAKAPKAKAKGKANPKPKGKKPTKGPAAGDDSKEKTPYALAKMKFMDQSLVQNMFV